VRRAPLRDGKIARIDTYLSDIDITNAYFTGEPAALAAE
jgi:hypothetical protein